MNRLYQEAKERSRYEKYKTLPRIKAGRAILFIAALPLCSAWMFPIGVAMSLTLSPSVWAKSKIIDFKEWRLLQ